MIALETTLLGGLGRAEVRADRVTGVQVDSRRIVPGDLFVAVGKGTDFLDDAVANGAVATLIPGDAFAALARLGGAVRERSSARVVAITGSMGKTSTKDILAALCTPTARTIAAEASYNNEIGVPLTLCRLEEDTEVCILELAMRGFGQIAELAAIARPEIGAVTNVGPVHLELVDSLEGVARAKGELIAALPPGGTAIVPSDFPVARDDIDVVRIGEPDAERVDGRTVVGGVSFNFTARHQVQNAATALAALDALGLPRPETVGVDFARWRGEEDELPGGGLLINDAYNANPSRCAPPSVSRGTSAGPRRRVAILGDMAELGRTGPQYHREVGGAAAELGVDELWPSASSHAGYLEGGVSGRWVANVHVPCGRWTSSYDPGDAVLVKASQAVGLEAVAEALTRSQPGDAPVIRVLAAGVVAMIVSIVVGPKFIAFLRKNEFGQHIREELPEAHRVKQGTPTMGGLLILVVATGAFLAVSRVQGSALTVLFVTLGCGAIGFLDDFIKLTHRRSSRVARALEAARARLDHGRRRLRSGTPAAADERVHSRRALEPRAVVGLVRPVVPRVAGTTNGVNLTDGLDGLAAGTGIIAMLIFTAISVVTYIRSGNPGGRFDSRLDLAIVGAALIGATIGFLWYNAFPAEVIMGDTGAMAIGGALAAMAIFTQTIFLLLFIGGIFLIEALSVIVQVISFKYYGRRVFLMAPIHYHFEMKAWSETKIVVRFWIVTAILCAIGFALFYRDFTFFRR
jgi:phospho-N-acetylmuramoyl-pentapeptide-transferase